MLNGSSGEHFGKTREEIRGWGIKIDFHGLCINPEWKKYCWGQRASTEKVDDNFLAMS